MVKALEAARKAARKAQEDTYEGLCTIIAYRGEKNEDTGLSGMVEEVKAADVPCKLSFEKLAPAVQSETGAAVTQGVKLFLAPEVRVKSGSKIIVTQEGVTSEYQASGVPAVYPTHQEIMLELWEEWA